MDPYQQAALSIEVARLRTDYRTTTALPVEIRAAMLMSDQLYPAIYPVISPYYPTIYPYTNPYPSTIYPYSPTIYPYSPTIYPFPRWMHHHRC